MKGENPKTLEFQPVWRSEVGNLEEEILLEETCRKY